MAFILANFSRVSGSANGNAPVVWSYRSTTDATAAIEAAGYFLSINSKLTVGDFILVNASDANHILNVATVSATACTTTALV